MKISCAYCGRIHDRKFNCGKRPVRVKKRYEKDAFRSTAAWQHKTEEIKERDHYLCQICFRDAYCTVNRLNGISLSVHHARPLKEHYEARLDNDNLLTICEKHHKMADAGIIPLDYILEVIGEQEKASPRG